MMHTKEGELKNTISIDGVEYVSSPKRELEKQQQLFELQTEELQQKIKDLEFRLKQSEMEKRNLQMLNSYQYYLLERLVHGKYEGRDIEGFEIKVELLFREEPSYSEEISKKVRNMKEALLFVLEQLYDKIDRDFECKNVYCEIKIETSYQHEKENKIIIPELSVEFIAHSSKEMTMDRFLSILKDGD